MINVTQIEPQYVRRQAAFISFQHTLETHDGVSLWRNWGCPLSRLTSDTSDNPKIFKPDGDDVCFRGPVDVEPLETDPVLPLRFHHPVVGLQRVHCLQHRRDSADIWVDLIRWDLSEIVLEERVLPECPPRSRLRDSCTVGFAPGHSTVSDLTFSKTLNWILRFLDIKVNNYLGRGVDPETGVEQAVVQQLLQQEIAGENSSQSVACGFMLSHSVW